MRGLMVLALVLSAETAAAVLAILEARAAGKVPGEPLWRALTVAHESHHIGFEDAGRRYEVSHPGPARQRTQGGRVDGRLRRGPGSAGGRRLSRRAPDAQLQAGRRGALRPGREITRLDVADDVAFTFFGYRGPWYTVGYAMGAAVEKHRGRAALVACMLDPHTLLAEYNHVAEEQNATGAVKRALWSPELLKAVGAEPLPKP